MKKLLWIFFIFIVNVSAHRVAEAEVLITDAEAALPASTGVLANRGISRGPVVKLESPEADAAVAAPFKLKVRFEPRGDAKIDLLSIKVSYLKSPLVDLTPRLKYSISGGGIEFSNATAPAGTHPIKVTVKDSEGRETNLIFNMVISR